MKHILALLFAVALIGAAFGQAPPAGPTPEAARLEAVSRKLLAEIDAELACSSDVIRLRAELTAARAELAAAQAKLDALAARPAPAAPEAKP